MPTAPTWQDTIAFENADRYERGIRRATRLLAGPDLCLDCLADAQERAATDPEKIDHGLCSQQRCKPCHEIVRDCWPAHRAEITAGTFHHVTTKGE